jgi:cupin 2 domain-containing protein
MHNLFEGIRPGEGAETVEVLLRREGLWIEKISSNRAGTDWYDQEEDEWVVLLEGEATLQTDHDTIALKRGDWLLLGAHERHRVVTTSADALWLAVFAKSGA